jgi:hypothetical protein
MTLLQSHALYQRFYNGGLWPVWCPSWLLSPHRSKDQEKLQHLSPTSGRLDVVYPDFDPVESVSILHRCWVELSRVESSWVESIIQSIRRTVWCLTKRDCRSKEEVSNRAWRKSIQHRLVLKSRKWRDPKESESCLVISLGTTIVHVAGDTEPRK